MFNNKKSSLGQKNYHLHLLAASLLLSAVLAMTWPLVHRLNTHVPTGHTMSAVPHLNLWTLAWNHRWFGSASENYWDANQFHPFPKVLAYSEPQFGTAVLTLPLVILGATTTQAYNLVLLGFIWSTGITTYLLSWYLFEQKVPKIGRWIRWTSALVAGILFGLNPYIFRQIGVLQLLALPFLPLTLLGLHRFFSQKRWKDAVLLIASVLGSWYTCAYYGLFLSLFIGCFVMIFWDREIIRLRTLIKVFVVVTTIGVCLIPLAKTMFSVKNFMSMDRPEWVVFELSAVLQRYFSLPQDSLLYGKILGLKSEIKSQYGLFLGGMLMLLTGVGIVTTFQICASSSPEQQDIGFRSRQNVKRSLRRYKGFYISMASVAFLLSFGLTLIPLTSTGMGAWKILRWFSPYYLLYKFVPGFSSIRSVDRFSIFCAFFLSILAGWGMLWLLHRCRSQFRWILAFLLIAVTILEVWPTPPRLMKVAKNLNELPPIYQHVSQLPNDSVLLEFPMRVGSEITVREMHGRYLYRSIFHWLPLVNGYSGFFPRASEQLKDSFTQLTPEVKLSALRAFGVQYVLVHGDTLTNKEEIQLHELQEEGLRPLFREGNNVLYQLEERLIENPRPLIEPSSFSIYESNRGRSHVALCLYYQVGERQSWLTTRWQAPIECEVLWYSDAPIRKKDPEPTLTSQVSYRGSKLMIPGMNFIEISLSAPPPGRYEVVVRPRGIPNARVMSGICQLEPTGFVVFHIK